MSLILKNRTTFSSLYTLDKTCFTQDNTALLNANSTFPNLAADVSFAPAGVLGGTVAALKTGASYTVIPADGEAKPIGLFVNNAFGNAFDNSPAVASNKIAIAQKMASVEVDIYEGEFSDYAIGEPLYASVNGYLTNSDAGLTDKTVIGVVNKLPTVSDPFLGLEMSI